MIKIKLDNRESFSSIAAALNKAPSTISREIRSHLIFRRIGGRNIPYNSCVNRRSCTFSHICSPCHSERHHSLCRSCSMCNALCKNFEKETCRHLLKPPYTCNGCIHRLSCSLEKRLYDPSYADSEYRKVLSESRSGISLSENEVDALDKLIYPLISQKSQSLHHICVNNADALPVSERTLYRYIDNRIVSSMNMDLPRKVRFSARKNTVHFKVDKSCRIGRSYDDFLSFMTASPDTPITEIDSVEGIKGGHVLLTIHFVKAEFMLAYLRESNNSKSVTDIFDQLYIILGHDDFCKLFPVLLGDNGSEFSNPTAIEFNSAGQRRSHVFYCNPSAPYQKGSAERNHEFIRCFIPKGKDFSSYSQNDISLMMNHINSYTRESLGNKSPYEMFAFLYGKDILERLECRLIPPQDVTLNDSIFTKEDE